MIARPCIKCGDVIPTGTHCTECKPPDTRGSSTRRGYTSRWAQLSKRARRLQPWCSDCGTTDDLTVDHSPDAWQAHAQGRAITLDLVDVVCRSCNTRRGRAR